MKKLIAILLCAVLLLMIGGCFAKTANHTLKVGFGRVDITPTVMGMPMRGSYVERYVSAALEPIYATCIAFTDEEDNTILLFNLDLQDTLGSVFAWAKNDIEKALGIPQGQIMMSATHMHRCQDYTAEDNQRIVTYNKQLREWLVEAATQAMADRKPAEMYTTSFELEGYNFVKHYIMNDGSYVGSHFGSAAGKTYVMHESEPDREFQMVKFVREGGEDLLLVNWQAHPHLDGVTKDTIYNDIVGALRKNLEERMNCKMAYFQGAAGNIDAKSRIKEEMFTTNCEEFGEVMATQAIAAANFEKAEVGKVQILHESFPAASKKSNAVVTKIESYVFSIGDVAFITAPYEMFSKSGEEIKDGSPFKTTFIVGYANGYLGYMPRQENYYYGDLESYEARSCKYAQGTAEEHVAKYIEMLKEIYPTAK